MINFWTALRGAHRGSAGQADGVAFLFFDAAGFGVNTAVKSSQLRAIFRTGVRLGVDLPNLAEQMDRYLRNDVPESGPVRAWFGLLDGHDSRLSSLCAGHETVLRYVASEEVVHHLESQSSALGVEEEIAVSPLQSVQLARGDIISVVSDGVVDALSPVRERFGVDRIKQVITEHHQDNAAEIVGQLRKALTDFSSGSEVDEDRTILLIKCV
jgi:sigma-B regulation protein RsbU (phosphoserine phosphatase)